MSPHKPIERKRKHKIHSAFQNTLPFVEAKFCLIICPPDKLQQMFCHCFYVVLTYFCLKYFAKEYLGQLCFFSCNKILPKFALFSIIFLYVKNSPIFSRVSWGHSLTHRAEDVLRTSKIQNVLARVSSGCSVFQKVLFGDFSGKKLAVSEYSGNLDR